MRWLAVERCHGIGRPRAPTGLAYLSAPRAFNRPKAENVLKNDWPASRQKGEGHGIGISELDEGA